MSLGIWSCLFTCFPCNLKGQVATSTVLSLECDTSLRLDPQCLSWHDSVDNADSIMWGDLGWTWTDWHQMLQISNCSSASPPTKMLLCLLCSACRRLSKTLWRNSKVEELAELWGIGLREWIINRYESNLCFQSVFKHDQGFKVWRVWNNRRTMRAAQQR